MLVNVYTKSSESGKMKRKNGARSRGIERGGNELYIYIYIYISEVQKF